MKNAETWQESKFEFNNKGKLIASRDPKKVGITSRLAADIVAGFYDEYLPKYAKGSLLDLGCGTVPLYKAYKDLVDEVTCVDWANSFDDNLYLDHFCDLNEALPLQDNTYDTIILSDVLEHIKEPRQLWDEMGRIIKTDGTLIMNVPFFYWLHAEPYDYYRYTRHALQAMAEESGFEVVELKTLGGVPEILADIVAKTAMHVRGIGKPSAIIIQNITSAFIKTGFGKKVSEATSAQFPFGYRMIARKS